jgi:hypothetical protein
MMNIYRITNLTQHQATPDQKKAGVVDLSDASKADAIKWMTFGECPVGREIDVTVDKLIDIARDAGNLHVMIGGAPFLMGPLERGLIDRGFVPLYSFTKRVTEEVPQDDGTVVKKAVFKHESFVDPTGSYYKRLANEDHELIDWG